MRVRNSRENYSIIYKIIILSTVALFLWNCEYSFFYSDAVNLQRNYEWYKSQMNTGTASINNCGPAVVSMAIDYVFNKDIPVNTIRKLSYRNGGWWYPSDIKKALRINNIDFQVRSIINKEQIMQSLSEGNLIIINLNMASITKSENSEESYYNKYYSSVTGHFLIIKGYLADKDWFIVYDPNNWDYHYYQSGEPYGKDRYYQADEIVSSIRQWWPYFIEVNE